MNKAEREEDEDSDNGGAYEDVLAVPKRMTQQAHKLLIECKAVSRPYNLEGRFGWRTHALQEDNRNDDDDSRDVKTDRMAIPILKGLLLERAKVETKLSEFLQQPNVEILVRRPFFESLRAREPPEIDARIHPEREIKQELGTSFSTTTATSSPATKVPTSSLPASPTFTYAELFAGIGGFGVALEALGGRCVFVSELEEYCRDTYKLNFPNTRPDDIHGDIYKVTDEQLPASLDILVGGFPCQPFSALGDQPGLDCAKGRGSLFMQIVRCLKRCQPKAFLCENVPGLLTMKETYDTICDAFEECGYSVTTEVCSARGVTATGRKRLFFVGIRNDLDSSLLETPADDGTTIPKTKFRFPYVPDMKLSARDCLDYDTLPQDELDILRLASTTFQQLSTGKRWRPGASLAWPNTVCDTLTSHYGNSVGRGDCQLVPCGAPHPPRRFSVREAARLMGFPNTYRFAPQRENQGDMAYRKEGYRMVGNAVCPPLIAAIAGAVLSHALKDDAYLLKGQRSAIELAKAATRSPPVILPRGCLVPSS